MTSKEMPPEAKCVRYFRDVRQTSDFLNDWDRLKSSGKHDMSRIKEAMTILALNDEPMSPEWKDHQLEGKFNGYRECHVKGDLLLLYKIRQSSKIEILVLSRICTRSELFGR